MRKLLGLSAAVALLLSVEPVVAGGSPCSEWAVGAHALYFTPIACRYAYAQSLVRTGGPFANPVQLVPCRAEWGFRVFADYACNCTFARVSYQWFEVSTTRSIDAGELVLNGGTLLGPGRATGRTRIEYQNVDVRLGWYLLQGCRVALYLYGNGRWIDLSHRRAARFNRTTDGAFESVQERSQFEGGALGIGIGGEFDIWCGIGAFVDGNFLGAIGERSLKNVEYVAVIPGQRTRAQPSYPSDTCVIPEVDFRIGLNYTYQCGCWQLVGEIGYELDYFRDASAFPRLVNESIASTGRDFAPVCEDLGFSGLFVGARLVY